MHKSYGGSLEGPDLAGGEATSELEVVHRPVRLRRLHVQFMRRSLRFACRDPWGGVGTFSSACDVGLIRPIERSWSRR